MTRRSLPDDEEAWVDRIRAGDTQAVEALFRAYYENLVEFVAAVTGRQEVARELVQELFVDIWRRGEEWQPQGALRPYLYAAARNKARAYFRSHRRRRAWEVQDELPRHAAERTPEDAVRYSELARLASEAIESLPERRKQVFQMSRNQGLKYAEIAAVLGISINTVEDHMVKAIKHLRRRLAPYLSLLP